MKAVAPDAGVMQLGGQSESLCEIGCRAMKRGIEAGDLRKSGPTVEQQPDRREVVRLMQWRERYERFQLLEKLAVDARGRGVCVTAVHHAMSDAEQPVSAETPLQEGK